jgi:hypothetical protein
MTKRTRIFLSGAGGILVAGLGTGVFASYVGGIQNVMLLGGGRPAELAYVPADAKMLAFANFREVMDSELRNKFLQLHMPDAADPDSNPDADNDAVDGPQQGVEELYEATGVDVEKDIDHLVATMAGTDDNNHPLLIARGRFDNGRIEAAIQQKSDGNVQIEDYKGIRLVSASENDGDRVSLAFAEPGVLVMGSNPAVKRAIDAKQSGNDVRGNAELMKFVDDVDNGNAWVVSRFDAITGQAKLPQEIASQLPPITWFAASGHVNGGVAAMLRAETRDDASAENLREVIRGFMALARLQAGQHPQFADLLNTIELGGEGKSVSIGFSISSEMIDAIAALREAAKPVTGAALNEPPLVIQQALRSW